MDRAEALAVAMEVVDDATEGTSRAGTAPERASIALDIARFLVEAEEVDDEEADDDAPAEGLSLFGSMPAGPAARVQCAASPGDFAYVRAARSGERPFVYVEVEADGNRRTVALDLAEARAYAAAILNAADDAEGKSPLLMFRPDEGPDAGPVAA